MALTLRKQELHRSTKPTLYFPIILAFDIFSLAYTMIREVKCCPVSRHSTPSTLGPNVKDGIERIRTVVINYYHHKIKLNELPLGERGHQLLKIARTERLFIESMVVQYRDKQDGEV